MRDDADQRRRRSWTVGLTAIVIAAATLSPLALPHPPTTGPPDLPLLFEQAAARERTDLFSSRPAYVPEPDGEITTATPPAAVTMPSLVSKTVRWGDELIPYLIPDSALPYRYHVDRRLVERYGLDEVIAAMQQWDDVPGSRWSTEFISVVDHPDNNPRPDGTPVVYLREGCPSGYLGGAFWNSSPARAHVDPRYGSVALFSTQVDIGICPSVDPQRLAGVIAHEVGHVMGQAHLCEPGEICWTAEMAEYEDVRRCRAMYYRFGPCRGGLTAKDENAARHLYPTLPRLAGNSRAEVAARASFATTWTHRARRVVLARTDQGPLLPGVAAAYAGAIDAPLLLSEVTERACLEEPAREELVRAASAPGRVVLVGQWPERCIEQIGGWNLRVEHLDDPDAESPYAIHAAGVRGSVAAATALIEHRRDADEGGPDRAFIVPSDDHPDALLAMAAAAAAAGRHGAPLLVTAEDHLSGPVDRFLAEHPTVRHVTVVGRPHQVAVQVIDRLWALGIVPQRIHARDPITFSTDLASREWPVVGATRWENPVVLAPLGSVTESFVGASLAGRIGAPLLLTGVEENHLVTQWLQRRRPTGGYLVAGTDRVPYELQWAYTTHVRPGDAVPSLVQSRGGGVFGTTLTD